MEAFLQILLQRESLRALDERILSASKELENADRLRQKGLVLGSDYYAAEGILSGLKAWQAQLSAKLSEAGYRLSVLAGETLTPAGKLSEKPYPLPDTEALLSRALESRADLKAAALEERSAEVQRRRTDSSLLPRADAFAAIGINSGDLSAAPSDRMVGVRLHMPFGDPAYPAKREGARALVEASRLDREALGDSVKSQVLSARAGYLGAASTLPLAKTTLERSQKSLELFRPLYREGRQSVLEVLRAEEAVARSQLQLLEAAQARGVRGADVDHEVVGERGEQPRRDQVVVEGVLDRDDARLADVDADHRAGAAATLAFESTPGGLRAGVVEAHPVDHGAVGHEAEQPRPGIARLRHGGDRADLDVPEAQNPETPDAGGLLVESGGQAERRREPQSERLDGERRMRTTQAAQESRQQTDDAEREVVRPLGVHPAQDEAEQEGVHPLQAIYSPTGVSVLAFSTRRRAIASSKSSRESKPW